MKRRSLNRPRPLLSLVLGALLLAGLLPGGGCDREDNDWAAFDPDLRELVVETDTLRVEESGAGASFRVALRMVPQDTVFLLIRPRDEQLVVEPDTLVLPPVGDEWAGERRIAVSARDDRRAEGPHGDRIDVIAASRDAAYDGQGGEGLVPVLIADDDLAAVAVSESLLTVVESSAGAFSQNYEVALLSQPTEAVHIAVASDPAEPTLHIEPAELTFTVEDWEQPQRVRLWVELDEVDGDDLQLQIGHTAASLDPDYGAGMDIPSVQLNVFDDTLPPIARLELVYDEEDTLDESDPATTVQVVVTLDRPSTEDVVVHLGTVDGTAVAGQDFEAIDEDLTFAPGDVLVQTREVTVVDDGIVEFFEEFEVALTSVRNLLVGGLDRLTIGIEDNDTTELTLSVDPTAEGAGAAVFTVSIPTTEMVPLGFTFETLDGTARAGEDYEAVSERYVLDQGHTQQTIPVVLLSDPDNEPDETFSARLVDLSRQATWSQDPVKCTILDDDPQSVALAGGDFDESDPVARFTLTTEAPYDHPVRMYLNALPGDGLGAVDGQEDAAPGPDFGVMTGAERTLPAGETELQIVVPLVQDALAEASLEYFRLEIASADQAGFAGLIATASIRDDDQPCLHVDDLLVDETDAAANFRIDLRDSGGWPTSSSADVVFDVRTMDQTAEAGFDYTAYSATLTIPAGETGIDVPIELLDDGQDDDSETFVLVLGPPTHATGDCRDENAFCRIADDEYPTLNLAAVAAERYNEGSDYEFAVRLTTPREEPTSFVMNVAAGTSNGQGVDYVFNGNGPQTILPGDTEMQFAIDFLDDQLVGEPEETLDLSIGGANVALGVASLQAVLLDAPELTVAGDAVDEGETAYFAVSLDATSTADVEFFVQYASGTATVGSDFVATNVGPFTISAGSSGTDVAVPVIAGDGGDASDETFVVTLVAPTNATLGATSSAIGTIHDMDPPVLSWEGPAAAVEGNYVELIVDLSWASEVDVQFEVVYTDGTATGAGVDYDDSLTGPFTVPSGANHFVLRVPTASDGLPELSGEDFTVTLVSSLAAELGAAVSVTGTVLDANQPELTIPAGDTTVEGGDLFFTVHLDPPTSVPVFFDLEYHFGSTQGAGDFDTSNTGPFSMMPGTTDTTITVTTFDDAVFEVQEAFIVRLGATPTNAIPGDPFENTGTIDDDD